MLVRRRALAHGPSMLAQKPHLAWSRSPTSSFPSRPGLGVPNVTTLLELPPSSHNLEPQRPLRAPHSRAQEHSSPKEETQARRAMTEQGPVPKGQSLEASSRAMITLE